MTAADTSAFTISTQPATAVRCTLDCTQQVPFSFRVRLRVTGALLVFPSWFLFFFKIESQIVTFCVKSISRVFVPHTDMSKFSLQTTC